MADTMDHDPALLARLCAAYGIDTGYHDIWGQWHAVQAADLVSLLAALGAEADTPQAAHSTEIAHAHQEWRTSAPPVAAVGAGEARWSLPLRLPDSVSSLRWRIVQEGGAEHRGVADIDAAQETARTELNGLGYRRVALDFSLALPAGYHRLSFEGIAAEILLVAAPARCYRPPALAGNERTWGPAVQLYALRSERNWGIGDFGDLERVAAHAAHLGAGLIGLNPLHALFPHNPDHASPYSPSSRLRLNALYLDVEAIDEFRICVAARDRVSSPEFRERLAALRAKPMVDYPAVAALKSEVLTLLYAHFRQHELNAQTPRGRAFRQFQAARGASLRRHALWEALQARFHAAEPGTWGWPVWPQAFRACDSAAVARFEREHLEEVEYREYLQWEADTQLARVQALCKARGLAVGLYMDLAVSVDRAGSDTWTHAGSYALDASIGAPPDEFNPGGQGWGLPPLHPARLREDRYRLFIETLRETMRHAGALRIDHVMGLMRLYWIPPGKTAVEGAYVHYALQELLAIVALESERNRCMVIGEDLGTVADAMRAALARFEVLSYRLLYFERDHAGGFKLPRDYPREALVAVSTHDLATLTGWWAGHDLDVRRRLGLFPRDDLYERQRSERAHQRGRLLEALRAAGVLPPEIPTLEAQTPEMTPALADAIHAYLAASPSRVMMVQLEDVAGAVEQANLPGTTGEHPNWKRKLPQDTDALLGGVRMRELASVLTRIREGPA